MPRAGEPPREEPKTQIQSQNPACRGAAQSCPLTSNMSPLAPRGDHHGADQHHGRA
jgi:hypothetical protein